MMRANDREEKLAWLRLARSPGIGAVLAGRLLARFGSAAATLEALPGLLATDGWQHCRLGSTADARRELDLATHAGIAYLGRGEPGYPARLLQIPDPPVVLALAGTPALLERPAVALVGARNASSNGRMLAHAMAQALAGAGVTIVSGLARGIDTAAHRGALDGGGTTVAVVAGGVDVPYPLENEELLAAIVKNGVALSERPLGAVPRAKDFPRRNRIIAGLAMGVVVIEAAPRSGSLITARLAAEQGREVMAVPGSPLDPRHRGTNQLLREGATLVERAEDVLELLRPQLAQASPGPGPSRPATPPPVGPSRAGRSPQYRTPPALDRPTRQLDQRLREAMGPEPVAVDELVRRCEASVAAIQAALLDLELDGRLERHPGNRVSYRVG